MSKSQAEYRDCDNCNRPEKDQVCSMKKRDIDICLQNPSRPFWQPVKTDKDKQKIEKNWSHKCNCQCPECRPDLGHNNGGSTDYYKFQPDWTDCQDVIESRGMNFSQGNIFKVAFCFNQGRHSSSTYERELNKIIWFAQRELDRVQKELLKYKEL